ncbi:MAG: malate dehydrogenase (oxaloacetate-decarboxylating) [Parcubacteria group bacterium Gr01-1014_56]|nr:MAG: malate dehydrogenase (oxaloacetate-decarboxylating) [Parcubacteria group bacterium Gr01-1014_56]
MKKDNLAKRALALHKKLGGKIRTGLPIQVKTRDDLSLIYTPGVGAVSSYIAKHKNEARHYTIKGKMIAVISDGSAVLGLGNIGPEAALPVMEGKAALFKTFADVDAFPIVLSTQDTNEIIETIVRIAPTFAGINLEDFSAPRCFEIEEKLKARLDIPVMHDDQHGTAIVVVAGLMNAAKVVGKKFQNLHVVISGAGAAGTAVAKLLLKAGVKDIIVLDSKGIIVRGREKLVAHKEELADTTNPRGVSGDLHDALRGADAVVGVSGPNLIKKEHIARMAKQAIVFALANPVPEIMPEVAKAGGAAVIATGRSDFPNQINNSLVFPGVFRGALDNNVKKITDDMKLQAAKNLAALIAKPTSERIIPGPFEKGVAAAVAKAIR